MDDHSRTFCADQWSNRWPAELSATAIDLVPYRMLLESALAYAGGTHTVEDVERLIADGSVQFWPGPHSCVVTEFDTQPQKKTLSIFLAAGDAAELEAMEPGIMAWGREQGCAVARFVGRRGWERSFLKRMGWANTNVVVMEKAING